MIYLLANVRKATLLANARRGGAACTLECKFLRHFAPHRENFLHAKRALRFALSTSIYFPPIPSPFTDFPIYNCEQFHFLSQLLPPTILSFLSFFLFLFFWKFHFSKRFFLNRYLFLFQFDVLIMDLYLLYFERFY